MRLCANENIPEACVVRLRQAGHDVLWIRETTPGSPDNVVLALAASEDRLLITFDKDFGELISGVARRHRRASFCFASRSHLRESWPNASPRCWHRGTIGPANSVWWKISPSA